MIWKDDAQSRSRPVNPDSILKSKEIKSLMGSMIMNNSNNVTAMNVNLIKYFFLRINKNIRMPIITARTAVLDIVRNNPRLKKSNNNQLIIN